MPQQTSERVHAPLSSPAASSTAAAAADGQTRTSARRRNRSRRRVRALLCAGGAITAATALGLTALAEPPALAEAGFVSATGPQGVTVPRDAAADSDRQPVAPSSPDSSPSEKETKVSTLSGGKPEIAEAEPAEEPAKPSEAPAEPSKKPSEVPAEEPSLAAPLSEVSVASPYGNRVNPMGGYGEEMHTGTDFAGACGTPVLASDAGTVTESGWHAYGGGQRIVIDHGGGVETTYNHLSSLGTTVGDKVGRAKPIGAVGTTGNSTGCHLHFEVVVDGQTVDPSTHL